MNSENLWNNQWKVSETRITRVRVVGPVEDLQRCLNWVEKKGYRVVRSGSYTDVEMSPESDSTRFLVIAERVEPAPLWVGSSYR
jgi:hypothetical protein